MSKITDDGLTQSGLQDTL